MEHLLSFVALVVSVAALLIAVKAARTARRVASAWREASALQQSDDFKRFQDGLEEAVYQHAPDESSILQLQRQTSECGYAQVIAGEASRMKRFRDQASQTSIADSPRETCPPT